MRATIPSLSSIVNPGCLRQWVWDETGLEPKREPKPCQSIFLHSLYMSCAKSKRLTEPSLAVSALIAAATPELPSPLEPRCEAGPLRGLTAGRAPARACEGSSGAALAASPGRDPLSSL